MENQHRKIKGYRELSQEEIDLMNEIKTKGEELGSLVIRLKDLNNQLKESPNSRKAVSAEEALRWVALGKTHLQQGLMALTRSVAKPDFF